MKVLIYTLVHSCYWCSSLPQMDGRKSVEWIFHIKVRKLGRSGKVWRKRLTLWWVKKYWLKISLSLKIQKIVVLLVLDLLKKICCDIEEGLIACSIVDVVTTVAVDIVFIIIIINYLFRGVGVGGRYISPCWWFNIFWKPGVIQPAEYRDELEVYFTSQIDRYMEDIAHKQVDIVFNILSMTWSLFSKCPFWILASCVSKLSSYFVCRIQLKRRK